MPLVDHFHPPLSERRQWHSFHSVWALPFWLKNGPCIRLDLDETYMRTLQEQRMLTAGAGAAVGPGP